MKRLCAGPACGSWIAGSSPGLPCCSRPLPPTGLLSSYTFKQFGGNAAYAVAAYNAGSGAVVRWQKALPQADIDEWVEHITFNETRDYKKNVLGNYSVYKLLYALETPPLRITTANPAMDAGLAAREAEAGAVHASPRR